MMSNDMGSERFSELMTAVQAGDQSAYTELLDSVTVILGRYFKRKVFQNDVVDDLIQETLIAIHRSRHQYQPGHAFLPWVFSIAYRKYCDYCRKVFKDKKRHELLNAVSSSHVGGCEMEEAAQLEELVAELKSVLGTLPEKQRRIVELMKLEEKSLKEVSEIMGMSVSAVKTAAHRGYRRLESLLSDNSLRNFVLISTMILIKGLLVSDINEGGWM